MSEEVKDKNLTQIGGVGVETLVNDPNWRTYNILRKYATGTARHGDIVDLRTYSNGVPWKNSQMCVGLKEITLHEDTVTIETNAEKLSENEFKITCYSKNVTRGTIKTESYYRSERNGSYRTQLGNDITCLIGMTYEFDDRSGIGEKPTGSYYKCNYKIVDEYGNTLNSGELMYVYHSSGNWSDGKLKNLSYKDLNKKAYIEVWYSWGQGRYYSVRGSLTVTTTYDNTSNVIFNTSTYTGGVEFLAYEK